MDLKKPVSCRQFAKMVGQAESAVRKAVSRSSIIEGKTADGKFIPEIAAREWGKDILPEYGGKAAPATPAKNEAAKPSRRKNLPALTTAEEIVKAALNEPSPDASDYDFEDEDLDEELDGKIGKPEAERITAILKAEILQIALREKKGELVSAKKIGPILFAYGQEVRVALEGLSNRVIDKILAVDSRHEAKRILDEEIYNTLNMLADIPNRKL
jgi:hypothetical protein